LLIDCSDDYPETSPTVLVQTDDGEEFKIAVPWQPDSHLTEVVVSAVMQVPFELGKRAEQED
jgi:hypothetical protein